MKQTKTPFAAVPTLAVALLALAGAAWAQPDGQHQDHDMPAEAKEQPQHGQMRMQGGDAPEDARDPHQYSQGFTLTEGPYALPGKVRPRLADEHLFWAVQGDRLEHDGEAGAFDWQLWYGSSYDKLLAKAEGELAAGRLQESQTELLWSHALDAYFDGQLGVRFDQADRGPKRQWLALGLQGLAPYWFEIDATAYLGEGGRTALAVEAEYELLLGQRLVLQPRAELTLYGKDDPAKGLGSGLSEAALGLRLRYEFSRQFAPYVGVEWTGRFGETADMARADGEPVRDTRLLAGLKFWF
ncbi:copper resistance protein B [Gallaecimonas sp. GXIMD4217]|uniref:copper resistance protein B n=1 Tax=Gallaecimonas sp. GXIMD4217 TaxID=3131927 RepID=UPI00311B20D4